MDRTRLLPILLLCGLLSGASPVHSTEPAAQPDGWSADEAQIRALSQASADAWNRGDLKGHLAIYAEEMTFMTRNGPRPGVEPLEKAFAEKYFHDGRPKQTLSFDNRTLRRLGPDASLETGRYVLSGGGEPEQSGWFTLVWVRTAAGWRVLHDHSS
ncbi:MAG TPA: nuclear transport factor 2 family protein [Thermoanaerobaculia bacterium]|nr:nuclear transport factor 2 family protein [Thermoanaerobaculia bacterium]